MSLLTNSSEIAGEEGIEANKQALTHRELFPNAVIHFEDFGMSNAHRLMERYRNTAPVFNDDIQVSRQLRIFPWQR